MGPGSKMPEKNRPCGQYSGQHPQSLFKDAGTIITSQIISLFVCLFVCLLVFLSSMLRVTVLNYSAQKKHSTCMTITALFLRWRRPRVRWSLIRRPKISMFCSLEFTCACTASRYTSNCLPLTSIYQKTTTLLNQSSSNASYV